MFLLIQKTAFLSLILETFTFHYVSTYTIGDSFADACGKRFTFHYVSTYTIVDSFADACGKRFTFHYVSTYTWLIGYEC